MELCRPNAFTKPLWSIRCRKRSDLRHRSNRQLGIGRIVTQSSLSSAAGKIQSGLVRSPPEDDQSWDSALVGNPVVCCFVGDNENRWFMWYTGRSKQELTVLAGKAPFTGVTGLVTSSDGIHWSTPVIERSETADNAVMRQNMDEWWAFDTEALAVSDVQIMFSQNVNSVDGVYWMFYSGTSAENQSADSKASDAQLVMRPGLAMSQDGFHWARIEGQHYSGSLFDVGEQGEWDALFIGRPQDQKYKIGLATSENGLSWKKQGILFTGSNKYEFDAGGAGAQCVAYDADNEQFVMFYEAISTDNSRSIGLSVSKDGLKDWDVYDKPILRASEKGEAWDSSEVGTPWAISMDQGKWRIYYSGTSSSPPSTHPRRHRVQRSPCVVWEGIGLCFSDELSPKFQGVPTLFVRKDLT